MEMQLLMESLLKCSDFADAIKPFHVHAKWAVRMTDEFFLQGDMERASGMRVSQACAFRLCVTVGVRVSFMCDRLCAPQACASRLCVTTHLGHV
jgi:hypothetical protein